MRLQRYLARSGAAPSRRKAEGLILSGRVLVNGRVATLGEGAGPTDTVELDGEPVDPPENHVHLALNKPAGYLTTLRDEPGKDRPTVAALVPGQTGAPGLVPVGRLDADTTGLLLFTSDGELANRVTHPSREVEKEYLVTAVTAVTPNASPVDPVTALEGLAAGLELDDGPMLPPRISDVRSTPRTGSPHGPGSNAGQVTFRLTIHEGRKRIIRRACRAVGLEVTALHRVRVGPVRLGGLLSGEYRELTGAEVGELP